MFFFFGKPGPYYIRWPHNDPTILETHNSICWEASWIFDNINRGKAHGNKSDIWPGLQNCRFLPLCRAIIVILDEHAEDLALDDCEDSNGFPLLDKVLQKQNVVLVLTVDNGNLGAPIDFLSIRAQLLPISRTDVNNGVEVVRAPLVTAVNFNADLQRKEEAVFPDHSSDLSAEVCVAFRLFRSQRMNSQMGFCNWSSRMELIASLKRSLRFKGSKRRNEEIHFMSGSQNTSTHSGNSSQASIPAFYITNLRTTKPGEQIRRYVLTT